MRDLMERGAVPVTGDLATHEGTVAVAEQPNTLGGINAVIHNAGVYSGPDILAVNVLAPYLLTCLITRPDRHIYLSSGMHTGAHADTSPITSQGPDTPLDHSDSKLFVTALAATGRAAFPESPQMQKTIEQLRPQLEAYEKLCDDVGEQPADVALAWLLHNPVLTATIVGPRTPEQLATTRRALDVALSDDTLAKLDEIWPGPGGEAPEAYAW